MAVYVDSAFIPFRRMLMCHMMADTTEELLQMADKIGVNRKWIQKAGTAYEHFDVCKKMRERAVAAGATEITAKELGALLYKRKAKPFYEEETASVH